jgi:DNA primase
VIPPAFIQELLARVDIVEVVGRQVQLKKSGINFSGLCPFHAEKSPSFTVTPTKQFYHCFGCGANGDAIRFLVEQNGMTFVDAVKDLAQQVGLNVPDDPSSPQEREQAAAQKQRKATLEEVLAKAAEHYKKQLKASPRAIGYLKGRGLTGEVAARFGLGYAPDGWRGLASVFPSYDDPRLEESGMVIVHEAESGDEAERKRYDRFRDRIMFPIRSVQGEIIGFGGRVLDRGEPKYLNSPETPVFSKGRELYGLHEARAALRQRGYALVVEGYMDVVALAQSGFENAVATLGTACTAEHVQKLFRFTESVVFSFDGDSAGRRAANRALEASLGHATDTRTIRFLFLPPEHDPDSYVRAHGAAAFEGCVTAAVPLSRQLLEAAGDGCDLETAEGRARLVAQARPLIAQLPTGLLRGQILDALASSAKVPLDELRQQFVGARPKGGERAEASAARSEPRAGRPTSSEPGRDNGRRPGGRRPLSPMASSLDRAVSLLSHRAELWDQLGTEAHDLLTAQPSPHGEFFVWLDRLVHEQGALARPALVEELGRAAGSESLVRLQQRVDAFHDVPIGDEARIEIEVIVDRLRLLSAQGELEVLAGTGGLSEAARARQRELLERQRQLKERLARPAGARG